MQFPRIEGEYPIQKEDQFFDLKKKGPDIQLSKDLRTATYVGKNTNGDNSIQTKIPMTEGRYQVSIQTGEKNHKGSSICIGVAKMFKKYGTYNT